MIKNIFLSLMFLVLVSAQPLFAEGDKKHEEMKPYVGSLELQKMKGLVGTWEGMHKMHDGQEMEGKVIYEITSNGSAVVETMFPGTPHEMVSVYYDKYGALSMTHYCSLANQPQMDLMRSEGDKIILEFADTNIIDAEKEQHMHGLILNFIDENTIEHNWTLYQEGKEAGVTSLKLSRVK